MITIFISNVTLNTQQTGKMAQRVKALAAQPDDPRLISRTQKIEEPDPVALWSLCECTSTQIHTLSHTVKNKTKKLKYSAAAKHPSC